MDETIVVRDIGPHTNLEIPVRKGVNILRGRNEAGKSLAIRAVAALAGTEQAKSLPIRDGQHMGAVTGFGTTLTVSQRSQRSGPLEGAESLEKLDISALVNPPLKDRAAAARSRIRALLSLTGTVVTLEDFTAIMPDGAADQLTGVDTDTQDPVELAGRVKRALEAKARDCSDHAEEKEREILQKKGVVGEVPEGVEIPDEATARATLEAAVATKTRLLSKRDTAERAERNYQDARSKLEQMGDPQERVANAQTDFDTCDGDVKAMGEELERLESQLAVKRETYEAATERLAHLSLQLQTFKKEAEAVSALTEVVNQAIPPAPGADQIDAAEDAVVSAQEQLTLSAQAARASVVLDEIKEVEKQRMRWASQSTALRDAAGSTDTVLAQAVSNPHFGVKAGELTAEDHEGVERPYDQLSEGARWKIAIQAIAAAVEHEQLLLITLEQTAWDGLSQEYREVVSDAAYAANVAIVTGQVDDGELTVEHFVSEPASTA